MKVILMKMILKQLFMSDLLLGTIDLNSEKYFKKDISKELMHVAWHPTKWQDWCMLADEVKEIELFFIDEKQ